MRRPIPTLLYHFTDIAHLESIVTDDLLANRLVGPSLRREAGQPSISRTETRARFRSSRVGSWATTCPSTSPRGRP